MNTENRLDLIHAEMAELHEQMAAEGGFLTSDPRYLRLKSLWDEEDFLEADLLAEGIQNSWNEEGR